MRAEEPGKHETGQYYSVINQSIEVGNITSLPDLYFLFSDRSCGWCSAKSISCILSSSIAVELSDNESLSDEKTFRLFWPVVKLVLFTSLLLVNGEWRLEVLNCWVSFILSNSCFSLKQKRTSKRRAYMNIDIRRTKVNS